MKKILLILTIISFNSFSQDSSNDRWFDNGSDTEINLPSDDFSDPNNLKGKLLITKTNGTGSLDEFIKFKVSDAINDFFKIKNGTAVDGEFIPSLYSHVQSSNRYAFTLGASTTTAQDNGAYPLIKFDGRTYTNGDLNQGAAMLLNRPLCVWTNLNVTRMILSASGNLGIGLISSPSAQLHTTSTVRFQGLSNLLQSNLIMADLNGNLSKYQIPTNTALGFISTTASTDALPRFDTNKNLINSQIFDNGTNIGIGGLPATNAKVTVYGVVNTLSDINEKKNIVHLENAMEIVNQLNGYNYEWRNSDEKQIGLIAQEVEKVLPEAVSQNEVGTKFLNYNGIIPVLTEALKEQQKVINSQNERINLLFKEIEKIKKFKK